MYNTANDRATFTNRTHTHTHGPQTVEHESQQQQQHQADSKRRYYAAAAAAAATSTTIWRVHLCFIGYTIRMMYANVCIRTCCPTQWLARVFDVNVFCFSSVGWICRMFAVNSQCQWNIELNRLYGNYETLDSKKNWKLFREYGN